MNEYIRALVDFLDFATRYNMLKCLYTILAGTIMLLPIMLIRRFSRKRNIYLRLGSLLLLLPMCLMGMNKLFFIEQLQYIRCFVYSNKILSFGKIYFTVMFVLLIQYIVKNRKLRTRVHSMDICGDRGIINQVIEQVTYTDRWKWKKAYLSRITVYVAHENISPFSGGILHPYIVLPYRILKDWEEQDIRIVLSHEVLHIKSGHIVFLFLFGLLRIYWWLHPAIYWCEKQLQEDIELACDKSTLYYTKAPREIYGAMFLNILSTMNEKQAGHVAYFFKKMSFTILKNRICYLDNSSRFDYKKKLSGAICAVSVSLFVLSTCILVSSYPRYTNYDTVQILDLSLNVLLDNTPELLNAISIEDRDIVINENNYSKLISELEIKDEYIYISYGGLYKLPNFGGLGEVAMISVKDTADITYINSRDWTFDLMTFLFKYM